MKVTIRTFEDRIEVDVPLDQKLGAVHGGGIVLRVDDTGNALEAPTPESSKKDITAWENSACVARFTFGTDCDPKAAAREAAALVLASTDAAPIPQESIVTVKV